MSFKFSGQFRIRPRNNLTKAREARCFLPCSHVRLQAKEALEKVQNVLGVLMRY